MSIIETERLILRMWDIKSDLKPWTAIISDPRVMEYFPSIGDENTAREFIENANNHIEKYGYGCFACQLKDTGGLIGFVGLNNPAFKAPFTPCVEIGWRLAYHVWGRGYAPEAARACLKFGFEHINLKEIVAFTAVENLKSRRVMEKLGMTYSEKDNFNHPKIDKDHPLSLHVLYRLKKDAWSG